MLSGNKPTSPDDKGNLSVHCDQNLHFLISIITHSEYMFVQCDFFLFATSRTDNKQVRNFHLLPWGNFVPVVFQPLVVSLFQNTTVVLAYFIVTF
jgi:hypothetical protein